MQSPLRKIVLAFILIALLPVLFIAYELAELNKNEDIVRETYQNQLDAILFSVNQYSDDVISSWSNLIRQQRRERPESEFQAHLPEYINQVDVLRYVYLTDLNGKSVAYRLLDGEPDPDSIKMKLDGMISANKERCDRLIKYAEAGFRKMQALDTPVYGECIPILFALDGKEGDYQIGVLVVDLPSIKKCKPSHRAS